MLYLTFSIVSSAIIFPVSVFCTETDLTTTDSTGIIQLFASIYTQWFWIPLIVAAIIWGLSHNDQVKEKLKNSMIAMIVIYVVASKWPVFQATFQSIVSKFGQAGSPSIMLVSSLHYVPFLFS